MAVEILEDKDQIIDRLKVIPPLSVGVCGGQDALAKLISNYWPIYQKILRGEKVSKLEILWNLISSQFKKPKVYDMCHAFVYLGHYSKDGEVKYNTVVETVPSKISWIIFSLPHGMVDVTDLKDKIKPNVWFKIFKNVKMTVDGMQLGRAYALGSIGRTYDLKAFLGFLDTNPNAIHDIEQANICTEHVVLTIRQTGVKIMGNFPSSKVHPDQLEDYLESPQGKRDGWVKVCEWDGKFFKVL